MRKLSFVFIAIYILIGGAVIFYLLSVQKPEPASQRSATLVSSPTLPIQLKEGEGTVRQVTKDAITIQTKSGVKSFPLSSTLKVQKITSGSLDTGIGRLANATQGDLKIGQVVHLTLDKTAGNVILILIQE